MAAIIRCCSSFTHTSVVRPPSHENSRGSETVKLAKSIIGYSSSPGAQRHLISKMKLLSTKLNERETSKGILQTPFLTVEETFDKKLSAFEMWQEIGRLKLPVMAVLFTNSLLMGTPLEALAAAEICVPEESSIFNMPVLLLVALVGATVGGLLARQRKGELQRLNEQLRQINTALRRQAKIESYAPGLSYAPVGARIPESEIIVDPKKQELISRLKTGKTFLRNQELEKAFSEFKIALELAQSLGDPIEEKKAARGLGASLQRQGKYREAIQYHNMVLAISNREGEDSGSTEAYGAIADCYTELGDLEKAGSYYDTYIARLETD